MTVSLAASASTPAAGTVVALTATTNGDVSHLGDRIAILDVTHGGHHRLATCDHGTTCTTTVVQRHQRTRAYVAVVIGHPGHDMVARSQRVVVRWR